MTDAVGGMNMGGLGNMSQQDVQKQAVNFWQTRVQVADPVDKQIWDLVRAVPILTKPLGIICAIINVFLPGWGTMISTCAGGGVVAKTQIIIGLLQFVTAPILVGYIWSWYWAYLIVTKAWNPSGQGAGFLPPRSDALNANAGLASGMHNNRQNYAMQGNPGAGTYQQQMDSLQ